MKTGWKTMFVFEGEYDFEGLNKLIAFETGSNDSCFQTEEDYNNALRDGFITFDGKKTTVWMDGE